MQTKQANTGQLEERFSEEFLEAETEAIEAYGEAIDRFQEQPAASILEDVRASHVMNRLFLNGGTRDVQSIRDRPAEGADWFRVKRRGRLPRGSQPFIILAEYEKRLLQIYKRALRCGGCSASNQELIAQQLIPNTEINLATLRRMQD